MGEAEVDDDESDDSFDEETGELKRKNKTNGTNGHMTDSSEEEDDEDEEAAEEVRRGFIVDSDDEDQETRERRRQEKKKRRREEREEEEAGLDEEDLDLIGENNPDFERREASQPKFKRLKQGHKGGREEVSHGLDDIFSDAEEDERVPDRSRRRDEDEMGDFIEADYDDDGEDGDDDDDIAVTRRPARSAIGIKEAAGLDENSYEDWKEVFGDGMEYDWALEAQDIIDLKEGRVDLDDPEGLEKGIELKDVFEPSQLADRMLTEEDNMIRLTDEPERFQIARKPYKNIDFTEEERAQEAQWISNLMLPKKRMDPDLRGPFQKAVAKVLEFMNTDLCEVPFIFQHRRDYLIHVQKMDAADVMDDPDKLPDRLLDQTDLWDIFDYDLNFRALIEKRHALQRTYESLQALDENFQDLVIEETLPEASTVEELQDIQDYLHFQHTSRLNDLTATSGTQVNGGTHRRPGSSKIMFDRIRASKVYGLVQAFGITADAFAQNVSKKDTRKQYTEDPSERPDDLADSDAILDPPEFSTGAQALRAAKAMLAEEIFMSPRMRKHMRTTTFLNALIDCRRTEKGARKIDDQHPYYEIKYLKNQDLRDIAQDPARFLRMLRAEEDGLVEVHVRTQNWSGIVEGLYHDIESDNFSEIADAWNRLRREALDMALSKLGKVMIKNLKESLRTECENQVAKMCREEYVKRLDQAPYKPKGMQLGTVPRALVFTNGNGTVGRDPIYWAFVNDDGRVTDNGTFTDLHLGDPERGTQDSEDVSKLAELVKQKVPDVIGVSGFSADTRKVFKQLEDIVERKDLRCNEFEDEDGETISDRLDIVIVNDEVARLYQNSERAAAENPGLPTLTRYCAGLGKYLQNPLTEYAALGRDIISISFDQNQRFIPQDKLMHQLETAIVDVVNMCGVDINEAVSDPYVASLLPYVAGLGPRKAAQMIKVININGGEVITRAELAGDADNNKLAAVEAVVWNNCASFLYINFESSDDNMDFLDNTRVHPEDYEIATKMASDALELDEEDIKAEKDEGGEGAIIRKLIRDDAQDKVNDLMLKEYAEQLDKNFHQRKRTTLETIRVELQSPYEELRQNFVLLSTDTIFTMFTGETRDSLIEGMIVPVSIKKVADEFVEVRMDCGIEGTVPASQIATYMDRSARQMFSVHQTVNAKILYLHRKQMTASFSLLSEDVLTPFKKEYDRAPSQWDVEQERKDVEASKEKNDVSGRTQRVIKHPDFRSFNAIQAEEYLGSRNRGDIVIRPSSKGMDHLAVTWKVSDNIYQHLDVLELGKSNDLTQGTKLKVGNKDYSDLDELISVHVKGMARKVEEMTSHEKYQNTSKAEVGKCLIYAGCDVACFRD